LKKAKGKNYFCEIRNKKVRSKMDQQQKGPQQYGPHQSGHTINLCTRLMVSLFVLL